MLLLWPILRLRCPDFRLLRPVGLILGLGRPCRLLRLEGSGLGLSRSDFGLLGLSWTVLRLGLSWSCLELGLGLDWPCLRLSRTRLRLGRLYRAGLLTGAVVRLNRPSLGLEGLSLGLAGSGLLLNGSRLGLARPVFCLNGSV